MSVLVSFGKMDLASVVIIAILCIAFGAPLAATQSAGTLVVDQFTPHLARKLNVNSYRAGALSVYNSGHCALFTV
jgi:hypothetical protein